MAAKDLYSRLMYASRTGLLSRPAYLLLKLLGAEIPPAVKLGPGCLLVHGGFGVVIHPQTRIGAGVKIYPGVTIGRADIHRPIEESSFQGIEIGEGTILASGAKILGREGVLKIGAGTVVGANAVLTESTGEGEIWAGVPARKIGIR